MMMEDQFDNIPLRLAEEEDMDWDTFLSDIDLLTMPPEEKTEHSFPILAEPAPVKKQASGFFSKKVLAAGLAVAVILVLLGSLLLPAALDPYDRKILDGVTIGGLDVGGMTRSEARKAIQAASTSTLERTALTLELPEETIRLLPSDTKVSVKASAAAKAAYRYGREKSKADRQAAFDASQAGQIYDIGLEPYLKVNEKFIRAELANYALQYDTNSQPGSYETEGERPDLNSGIAPESITGQTLHVTLGVPTARLNQEQAFARILAAYAAGLSSDSAFTLSDFQVDILEPAKTPDLQDIYEELCIAPVDDSLDMTTYKPVPGSYGYGFDLEQAQKLIGEAKPGDTVSLPMEITAPEIMGEAVYFRDVLGYCETPHTKDENRNHNLMLACKAMDGIILQPGDVFSYNDTLGQRTKERGYKKAGAYSGWELVQSYGGGICQGSSTIYCAALYADLEIVVRKNHGYKVGYIPVGLDATVNWGGPDFQFRNNTHFPIKIAAEVSDGHVKVTLLGTEERDYYVEMESESGQDKYAIYAKSYKCKYDRKTGKLISRELEARSTYNI